MKYMLITIGGRRENKGQYYVKIRCDINNK